MLSVEQTQAASSWTHEPWQTVQLKRRFDALGPRNSRQILVSWIRISRQKASFLVSDRNTHTPRRQACLRIRSNCPGCAESFVPPDGRGAWGCAFPPNLDPVGSCLHPEQKEFGSGLFSTFDRDDPTRTSHSTFLVKRKGRHFLFQPGPFPFQKEDGFGSNRRSIRTDGMDVRTIHRIATIRDRICLRIQRCDCTDEDGRRRREKSCGRPQRQR